MVIGVIANESLASHYLNFNWRSQHCIKRMYMVSQGRTPLMTHRAPSRRALRIVKSLDLRVSEPAGAEMKPMLVVSPLTWWWARRCGQQP